MDELLNTLEGWPPGAIILPRILGENVTLTTHPTEPGHPFRSETVALATWQQVLQSERLQPSLLGGQNTFVLTRERLSPEAVAMLNTFVEWGDVEITSREQDGRLGHFSVLRTPLTYESSKFHFEELRNLLHRLPNENWRLQLDDARRALEAAAQAENQ